MTGGSSHLPLVDYQLLFESVPGLYLVLTTDFIIAAVSDAYLKATKTVRAEILGHNMFEIFPDNPEDPNASGVHNLSASLERVVRDHIPDIMAVQKYDIRRPESEGGGFEERYWSPVNSPIFDKDHQLIFIMHRVEDVTEFIQLKQLGNEQRKLTEDLRSQALSMEAEIYNRAQALDAANNQLRNANSELARLYEKTKELDKLKTQFFANISHELRTPLTLILGPINKLLKHGITPALRQELQVVKQNANILLRHVNDLLDIAKLEAGKMTLNYVNIELDQLVQYIAANFELLAKERNITFSVSAPTQIIIPIDKEKIERILLNLLSNAFKFTPIGGTIVCSLSVTADSALIEVQDNGPGVPVEMREAIFERFYQVEGSATRRYSGTGLGLTIVKEFVQLHGGTIKVLDAPLGGAIFSLALPLVAPEGVVLTTRSINPVRSLEIGQQVIDELRTPTEITAPTIDNSNPLILVVEDNLQMSQFIVSILKEKYNVATAFNGQQGLEKALALHPELILSDMMMPLMSGEQLVYEIRNHHHELQTTPIILLTAKTDEELRVQLLQNGVQDYITKPFVDAELLVRIENQITIKRTREALQQIVSSQSHDLIDLTDEISIKTAQLQEKADLLDKARDAIMIFDLNGDVLYWNKGAERVYGWRSEEVIGQPITSLLFKEIRAEFDQAKQITIANGEWAGEFIHPTQQGKEVTLESHWSLVTDYANTPISIMDINTDVTEKKKIMVQFLRAQRMESIGTLASGIAHDLNNALTPIGLACELLIENSVDEENRTLASVILHGIKRSSEMIEQILAFARGLEGKHIMLQPKHLLTDLRNMLEHIFPKSIKVEISIAKDLWTVQGDATQLHQVLMNLSINARDAMPNGGKLTIKAENVTLGPSQDYREPQSFVKIAIKDTGTGIPIDIREKIFEPFFTTKDVGKGTGLGLSTTVEIINRHGGKLDLKSMIGKGTQFTIFLPATKLVEAAMHSEKLIVQSGKGELILFADDEAAIREMVKYTLDNYGYKVLTASDGAEALALYIKNQNNIKVVLTDIVMPFVDGMSVIRALHKIDDKLKIIVMSGSKEESELSSIKDDIRMFLAKPFTVEELITTIDKTLNN